MTRLDLIRIYSMVHSLKHPVHGRDPGVCVKEATWWVDRLLALTPEEEKKEEKKMDAKVPILKRPKH